MIGQSEFWRFLTNVWRAGRGRQISELEEDDEAKHAGDDETEHSQNRSENLAVIDRRLPERAFQSDHQQGEACGKQDKIDPRNIAGGGKLNEEWITEKPCDNEEKPSPDRQVPASSLIGCVQRENRSHLRRSWSNRRKRGCESVNQFATVADRRYRQGMKVAVVGAGGRLGAALMREYREKFDLVGFDRRALDLASADQFREKIGALDVDVVINCAALTNVDYCESHREGAFRINAEAPRVLAEICRDKKAKLIHISTDYVFSGDKREPYHEEDEVRPISIYGESKLAGEKNVLAVQDRHLVVRVSWVFGPDRPSFVDGIIKRARANERVDAIADKISAPSYTSDIAEALLRLMEVDARGIFHFSNGGECSWQEYGQWALDCCRECGVALKGGHVAPLKLADMKNFVARRPVYSVLSPVKYATLTGTSPRAWREAVADYIRRSYCKS